MVHIVCCFQVGSVTNALRDARAVQEDYGELTKPSTAELARIRDNHACRDFHRKFKSVVPFDVVALPLVNKKGELVYEQHPVIAPHEMWRYLNSKGELLNRFLGEGANLRRFWAAIRESTLGGHILKGLEHCDDVDLIPLQLHGDDAEAFKNRSYTYISWSGLAKKDCKFAHFLVCAVAKRRHYVDEHGRNQTLLKLGEFIRWSLEQLRAGVTGPRAFSGKPQQHGPLLHRGVLVTFQGDLSWFRELFCQARHYNCIQCCFYCEAERCNGEGRDLRYWDMSASAPWRQTCYEQPLEECFQSLLKMEGVCLSMIAVDMLHCIYIGVGEDVIGSCAMHVLRTHPISPAELWSQHTKWCSAHGYVSRSTYQCFDIPFRRPQNRHPHVSPAKGFDARVLILWFSTLRSMFEENLGLWSAVFHLAHFIKLLDNAGIVLTPSERDKACMALTTFLQVWSSLALTRTLIETDKTSDFKVRDKFHYLAHLERVLTVVNFRINPKLGATFSGESFVGDMASITAVQHPNTACLRTLQQFVLRQELYFQQLN